MGGESSKSGSAPATRQTEAAREPAEQEAAAAQAAAGSQGEPLMRLPEGGLCLRELERQLLVQALQRTRGNQTRAAALLGLNRDQIRYRIDKYGIKLG